MEGTRRSARPSEHRTEPGRGEAGRYDPETGRWTNKDPIGFAGQQGNVYVYVNGDPVNGVDPHGTVVPLAAMAAGGLVGGIFGGITYALTAEKIQGRRRDELRKVAYGP